MNAQAAEYALLVAAAEDAYTSGVLTPVLSEYVTSKYKILGYLTAFDTLIRQDKLGFGGRCYYGFVAVSLTDSNQFVIVIRGTANLIEWLENGQALLVPTKIGHVEQGFYGIYKSLEGVDVATFPDGSTVTVIGHSLGAAIATYEMNDLSIAAGNSFIVKGALFASPKCGDLAYVTAVDKQVGAQNYKAYAFIRDLVPHLPLTLLVAPFKSLPNTQWISPADSEAIIANNPLCNHHASSYSRALDYSAAQGTDICVLGPNTDKDKVSFHHNTEVNV